MNIAFCVNAQKIGELKKFEVRARCSVVSALWGSEWLYSLFG